MSELNNNNNKILDLPILDGFPVYVIDLSLSRFDITQFNRLKSFMTKNKLKYPNNLDYWEKILIICSNTDKIKITEYERFGGLPKYDLFGYVDSNGKSYDDLEGKDNIDKFKTEYNNKYWEKLREIMHDWVSKIHERINLRVFDCVIRNESFFSYFKKIAKELYENMSEEEISNYLKNLNFVPINNTDYNIKHDNETNYEIPNYNDILNKAFNHTLFVLYKDSLLYDKNWLETLKNKINKMKKKN